MDVSTLKVVELRRELRSRGSSTAGDKAELAERLRRVLSEEALDRELGLSELEPSPDTSTEPPAEAPVSNDDHSIEDNGATNDVNPTPSKKIVLNRTVTATSAPEPVKDVTEPVVDASAPVVQTKAPLDAKTRMEMRAKRFGLPPAPETLKEVRANRFGLSPAPNALKEARAARFGIAPYPAKNPGNNVQAADTGASLDVLRRRAERFGTSVSKVMTVIEQKEKLERRKLKFSTVST